MTGVVAGVDETGVLPPAPIEGQAIRPFSASQPAVMTAAEVSFPGDVYRSLTVPTWAICSAVESASHARLDRVAVGSTFLSESLSPTDLARIEDGLRHALGLAS